jgi:hypothetical protein
MPKRWLILIILAAAATWVRAGVYDDMIAAARNNDGPAVISLIQRGMDANTTDRSGNTLLMIAAGNGNDALVEFLLSNRANKLKINKYGETAIALAAFRGHLPVVRRLAEAGGIDTEARGWGPLQYAAFAGHTEIVRYLVERRLPVDARAPNGQTALMLAAANGHLEAVKLLVDADADMALADPEGRTALALALKSANTDIAEYLRSEGATH